VLGEEKMYKNVKQIERHSAKKNGKENLLFGTFLLSRNFALLELITVKNKANRT
jgi:hypothetical protein